MSCSYCRQIPHHPRCPIAPEPKLHETCVICEDGICDGEEYIENDNGEFAHWECVNYARDLAKFLGYEPKEMRGDYY